MMRLSISRKEGVVDPKRVCIVGANYGGYAAMRGAQRDGGLFRCAISYAGVSDLGALSRFDGQSLYGGEYVANLKEKAPDLQRSVSPIRFPEQFSTPILIMHGKNDLRVPVEQSRTMAAKLKAAGKDYRYVEQPLGDHHFSRQEIGCNSFRKWRPSSPSIIQQIKPPLPFCAYSG